MAARLLRDVTAEVKDAFTKGSTVRPETLQQIQNRRSSTSVFAQYEMYVMPIATFVSLSELKPHQELLAERKIKRWDPSMKSVFFLSHQWTSFNHPDYTSDQIRTFKSLLLAMKRGELGDVKSELVESNYGTTVTIKAEAWPSIADDAFIWMDFMSIPQPSAVKDGQDPSQTLEDMKRAIDSIPAYIERSTHFFAVCPPVVHQQLGTICDYGTWLGRGWCRLEQVCLLLARFNDVPAIVVKGGGSPPAMVASNVSKRPVGLGNFTCCARNHRIPNSDGVEIEIPCDKDAIAPLLLQMLKKRKEYVLGQGDLERFRIWQSATPSLLRGLKYESEIPVNDDYEAFTRRHRFRNNDANKLDEALLLAILEGSVSVAESVIDRGADVLNACFKVDVRELFVVNSMGARNLPMIAAVMFFNQDHGEAMLKLLLRSGADPNFAWSKQWGKTTVLGAAVVAFQPEAIRTLYRVAGSVMKVNATFAVHHVSTVLWATYAGDSECVQALLDIGADANYMSDHGSTALMNAVRNPLGDGRMLKMLFAAGQIRCMNLPCRATTRLWRTIFFVTRVVFRLGKAKNRIVLGLACQQGSTALHFAAAEGECESARWLLERGAHPSLFIKNKLGMTPMDMSKKFGPFPEMESLLGGAELDKDYARKWAIRRGSAMVQSAKMKLKLVAETKTETDGEAEGEATRRTKTKTKNKTTTVARQELSASSVVCSNTVGLPPQRKIRQNSTASIVCSNTVGSPTPAPPSTVDTELTEAMMREFKIQLQKAELREERHRDEANAREEAHQLQLAALMEQMRAQQSQHSQQLATLLSMMKQQ